MYLTAQMMWIVWGIAAVFLLVSMVMAICIPFWVLQIRNEAMATNRLLEQLVRLIGGDVAVNRGSDAGPTTP